MATAVVSNNNAKKNSTMMDVDESSSKEEEEETVRLIYRNAARHDSRFSKVGFFVLSLSDYVEERSVKQSFQ